MHISYMEYGFKRGPELGKGKNGVVYKVIGTYNRRNLAMKVTPLKSIEMQKYIESEMELQKILRDHGPKFINYSICEYFEEELETNPALEGYTTTNSVLVLPLCDSGELAKYVEVRKYLSEQEVKAFAYQILSAINFCHQNKIMHRDLKLENILLNAGGEQGNQLTCYLCDFGFAKQTISTDTIVGSTAYMAPEIFSKCLGSKSYSNAIDVWSFGIMAYQMLCGVLPFNTRMDQDAYLSTKAINIPQNRNLSLCAMSFLECCLQYNPDRRNTISELLTHEFITCARIPYYYLKSLTDSSKPKQEILGEKMINTEAMLAKKATFEMNHKNQPGIYSMYLWSINEAN